MKNRFPILVIGKAGYNMGSAQTPIVAFHEEIRVSRDRKPREPESRALLRRQGKVKTSAAKCAFALVGLFAVIGLMWVSQSYGAIDKNTIVGAWLFDDPADLGRDSSPAGNHGTVEGSPKSAAGVFGGAMELSGNEDDRIVVPDSDSLDVNHMTAAAWVYLNSYIVDQRIITKEVGTSAPYSVYNFLMSAAGDTLEFRPTLNNSRKRILAANTTPLKEWTHLAATYDGSQVVLYMNGEIDKSEPHSGEMMVNEDPVWLGGSAYYPRPLDGLMDEATLFNVALSQDDIRELMDTGLGTMIAVEPKGKLATAWVHVKAGN
jgi:hypothetical protein